MIPPPIHTQKWSKNRIMLAFAIAIISDAIDLPLLIPALTGFGAIPAYTVGVLEDVLVMVVLSFILGFHWVLLPSIVAEMVPGVGLLPTWTGSVAYLVWQQNHQANPAKSQAVIDVEEVRTTKGAPPLLHSVSAVPPQATKATSGIESIEARLERLNGLLAQNLISEDEYKAKREKILQEI